MSVNPFLRTIGLKFIVSNSFFIDADEIFKFPFKTKYFEQDFYVSSNNFSAYKLIESWPKWNEKWLNIFGVSGSGKTHLSKILEKKINKIKIVEAKKINDNTKIGFLFINLYHFCLLNVYCIFKNAIN